MSPPLPVLPTQQVTIVGRNPPSDDVTLLINGVVYGGWTEVRVTRGIERMPMDFEVALTDFFPLDDAKLQIKTGDAVVVKIGKNPVVTGYVDIVQIDMNPTRHAISVIGRSKCADLVDCSAEWRGGQIKGTSALDVASKLAQPYGITVDSLDNAGPPIPQFNLVRGETAWQIIERICRFSQLIAFDDPDGNVLIGNIGTAKAASGFREGVNVKTAHLVLSQNQRYSQIQAYLNSMDVLDDVSPGGGAGDLLRTADDKGVLRHRVKMIVAESAGGGIGLNLAKARAQWEVSRRFGRSAVLRITTDSWRDKSGALYEPNTLADLDLPSWKIVGKTWMISEVAYHKSSTTGTTADIVLMTPDAFLPQPTILQPVPAEFQK